MQASTVFHEDVFYQYFRPFRHPAAQFKIWGGQGLETFGADFHLVRCHDENFVWTVIDGSRNADQWITPGLQYVNRVCYLLTEVSHQWAPLEFRIERRACSLTPLGLKRRVTMLRRLLLANQTGFQ
jgi:hypothetical protein